MATLAEPEIAAAGETYSEEPGFTSRVHIPALDGLRGVAIIAVMLRHLVTMPATRAFEIPFVFIASRGWVGVELFFVLSGFLITGILIDTRGAPGYARTFYIRRALRIVPLYVAAVLALTLALPIIARFSPADAQVFTAERWWYWTHTTNILVARAGGWSPMQLHTAHFWSLAVEEQFYLFWPLLVALCPTRRLGLACLIVAGVSTGLRLLLLAGGVSPTAIYVLTPTHMDALALGGALAVARRNPSAWRTIGRYARSLGGIPAPLWGSLLTVGLVAMVMLDPSGGVGALPMQAVGYSLIALASVAVLAAALEAPDGAALSRWLTSSPLRALGRYSYGIYVLHYPLFYALGLMGMDFHKLPMVSGSHLPAQLLVLYAASAASFGLAWVSYHCLERHFLRLKRYFPVTYTAPVP